MNIENLIKDTFTAREHDAPDSDAVLAAARQRIDSRRSGLSLPLAVAAGATVLTLGAATAVVLNRPDPAEQSQNIATANGPQDSQTPAATGQALAGLQMPYSLGWLPPGSVAYRTQRINIGSSAANPDAPLYGGEYMLTVTADGQVLQVDVQQFRMVSVDEAMFKSGPGKSVTINGQRGVESAVSTGPGGYELYVEHPDGGSMYVHVSAEHGSEAPAQQLVDTGRRIAENIRFPGTTTVTPAYGLRDLPNGMRICAFEVAQSPDRSPAGQGTNTSYSLGTCTVLPSILVSSAVVGGPPDTPGQPVQGHATRYLDENGYRRLWILDAVGGAPVAIAGQVPQADLYDIANRLVLPR
ncbi:hypothetical protein SK854_42115 [Lentzea sp. BCCO 10_0061]|uniref:DUF4367 domain-containing protein n=1 Tax=Lentzea sokolovensis TaxID=3095429 RepID=A0ABU4VBN4_9PSEU|nr:hypothetical protein [Lentzea sp. BCCO 10_0061]MDX8148772.1 hypothetical protein [Lentzea sp. BCCO 10_0061]